MRLSPAVQRAAAAPGILLLTIGAAFCCRARSGEERAMNGRITKFYSDIGVGIIAAEDGRKFRFHRRDMTNHIFSSKGIEVDFVISAGRPRDIIPLCGSVWTAFGGMGRR